MTARSRGLTVRARAAALLRFVPEEEDEGEEEEEEKVTQRIYPALVFGSGTGQNLMSHRSLSFSVSLRPPGELTADSRVGVYSTISATQSFFSLCQLVLDSLQATTAHIKEGKMRKSTFLECCFENCDLCSTPRPMHYVFAE